MTVQVKMLRVNSENIEMRIKFGGFRAGLRLPSYLKIPKVSTKISPQARHTIC